MLSTLLAASLAGSCAAWPLGRLLGRRGAGWGLALVPAGLFAAFLGFGPQVAAGRTVTERLAWVPSLGVDFALRLDGFAYLFCLLVTGVGALVVVYAGAYFAERTASDRARFLALLLLFMTAMLGAVLADDLLLLFLFWEMTSVVSFLLIGFDGGSPSARRSALMSLRVTAGGGLALLAAVLLVGASLGTYSVAEAVARAPELARGPWAVPILGGILVGAFTKSAQFPFHFWLPNAMQAPTPASAYLHSATMVKLGVYLLARFEPLVGAVRGGRDVVIGVALATMLVGAFQAIRAENYKAVLAYSTVASLGILVMLVGLDGPMASVAAVGFLLAHALYKATLFFCAGTVIHATGLTKLRQLGGLGRLLPVTAAASLLASLSMAGLPPFLGFVSKEFLFEAQIESSWEAAPMAVAVLVNAVIVGVAGVVTLRPFFLGRGRVREVKHREVPGLLVGPVALALLGLVISLEPAWFDRTVLRPAVAAVYGAPVDVQVGLWHGVTPMLLLSAVVVGVGTLLFVYWVPIHRRLRAETLLDRVEAEHGYEALLRGIEAAAAGVARRVQRADLRAQLATVVAAACAFVGWGLLAAGVVPRVPAEPLAVRAGAAVAGAVGLGGAAAAARAPPLLGALLGTGLVGLVAALLFLTNGAPDLALTQFAVESLLVVLLTAALLALPLAAPPTRARAARGRDAALATALAAVCFVAVLDMSAAEPRTAVADFFGARSYTEAFGRNVVNVILVDFRGFDTLGETTVIALAAVIAWSLLGPRGRAADGGDAPDPPARPGPFVLRFATPAFYWLLAVLSAVVLLRGHNEIGGGFVGGLTAALAFAVVALAYGVGRARGRLRWHPLALAGTGLLLAVASGLPGLAAHGDYLRHLWIDAEVLGVAVKQGTTLLFDLGVYLAVLGAVLAFLFGLSREAER
ncbi:hydrogen gas-evolving membrane-bound hydrogenase subunit E [Roseisolibacter sp. H3M3-2]|uniref:hydrogen gas-evolving membrane-bound hydrogenase subunit E n=1 Tax=Roseisolibacter sp. H3M3-2 TaxID=3031323 RepID=UPI0023DABD87|nr:hydrogen gas-evolving membrane-bound hydrogenase subunit E [Roseisolibacter sp. H3M3-2]MDF1501387.1 proton-conducting transporter membrane subunit [Roseisolibacter sp. H3M3-2]